MRLPHQDFILSELPYDAHLTQYEVAQVRRQTVSWVEKARLNDTDGLKWVYVDGRPRCLAGSLQEKMKGSPNKPPPPPMRAKATASKRRRDEARTR